MRGINAVVLVGHLGKDPELRHTQGGTAVVTFSLAVNSREKVGEEWSDRVDWFDVTAWGNQAESCAEHLAKGSLVAVSGRLRQEKWQDKESKQNRSKVGVTADNVQFLGGRDQDEHAERHDPDEAHAAHESPDDFPL